MGEKQLTNVRDSAFQDLYLPSSDGGTAVTLGVFDGVHRGHLHLIERLQRRAAHAGLKSVIVTLRNHPLSVLKPDFEPMYLSTIEARVELLEATGVDTVLALDFDAELAELRASDFIHLLSERLEMRALVIGPDFAMGRGREGDIDFIRHMGAQVGFRVEVASPLVENGVRVGSTLARNALSAGNVSTAASILGRNFTLTGSVVRGAGRGGSLGFPTANITPPEGLVIPGNGIYASWVHLGDAPKQHRFMSATSVGTNPTFDGTNRTIETFVLDYQGNLYDSDLTIEFVQKLRAEERFATVAALQRQVQEDVQETRSVLGNDLSRGEHDR